MPNRLKGCGRSLTPEKGGPRLVNGSEALVVSCPKARPKPKAQSPKPKARVVYPVNSPTSVIETVTHTAAARVIQMPTRAMSRIEK